MPTDLTGYEGLIEEAQKRANDQRHWRALTPADSRREPHTATLVRELWEAGQFTDRLSAALQSALARNEELVKGLERIASAKADPDLKTLDNVRGIARRALALTSTGKETMRGEAKRLAYALRQMPYAKNFDDQNRVIAEVQAFLDSLAKDGEERQPTQPRQDAAAR